MVELTHASLLGEQALTYPEPVTLKEALVHESIAYWSEQLLLSHWELQVVLDPGMDEDVMASCEPHPFYDQATLTFRSDIQDDQIEYNVVHELVHVMLRDLDETTQAVMSILGYSAARGHILRHEHAEENLVDRLARVMLELGKADRMPDDADQA